MNTNKLALLILAITSLVLCKQKKADIVDANHYYSEQNKEKQYAISGLDKTKPTIVVLKPVQSSNYDNKITLTVKSGSNKKQCAFRSFEDLCLLQTTQQTTGTLNIKCDKLPCNVEWRIYQTTPNQLANTEKVQNLYKLPSGTKRMIVNVYCQSVTNKQQKSSSKIALAFSNSAFQSAPLDENTLYLVFEDLQQGYLYLNINPKYRTCAKMRITKGQEAIGGEEVQDYLKGGKDISYILNDFPNKKSIHFDMAFHTISAQKEPKNITISLTGQKSGERKVLRKNTILLDPLYRSLDFSYGVPQIDTSQWKSIRLQLSTTQQLLLTQIRYKTTEKIEVESTESSYFNLKKGEKLQYILIQQKKAEEKDVVNLTGSKPEALEISKSSCNVKSGCQFSVEAKQDIQGYVYIGNSEGKRKQILILDFGEDLSFTHKIKQLQSIYIKKKLQLNKAVQVTLNSPNVLVYMANTKKCPYPSESCYEQLGNINRHFIYYPDTEQKTQVMFTIKAIDSGIFTLTLLPSDTEEVNLKDSEPFVYLFDPKQESLKFKFKRESKVDVSFNLIAPLNSLDLIVANGKKIPEDEDALISAEGYLEFKASDAPKSQFTIMVRKRQGYDKKYVHFTLIASTKGKFIRLESGVTHYQTLTKEQNGNAEYIFQFDPNEDYILNFYCHNTKEKQINIKVLAKALSNSDNNQKDKKNAVEKLVIDRPSDTLDLSDISANLCAGIDDDDNCQISIQLQNQMGIEVDIAITLMSQHTILELKDGIWQSFSTNSIAKTAHFYFHPRNKQHDTEILFKTTETSLRLKYRLFYANQKDIDLSQWPFPSEQISDTQKKAQQKHRPVNHFSISKSSLNDCWPNCVVLISIVEIGQIASEEGSFSIMASNSIMEIPEKQKIDITLKEGESKSYLVDLKYALDIEQNIYFYIYHSIGLTSIFANVYSQKNDRVPDQEQFDFQLNSQKQIIIPFTAIKEIVKKQQMEDDKNIYLYIVVQSLSDSKASIQFTFKEIQESNEKLMEIDTYEHVLVDAHSEKIFYAFTDREFQVKIIREKGFPIYSGKSCKKDLEDCLKQIKQQKQAGTQILSKVAAYTTHYCENCLYVFKIKTDTDPADVSIHLQSKSSQIQLVENRAVYDFTEKDQSNSYTFYGIRGEQIYVNIHITEGEIEAQISDLNQLNQKKTGQNIISFVIPASETKNKWLKKGQKQSKPTKQEIETQQKQLKSLSQLKSTHPHMDFGLMEAFGFSDKFIQVRVTIKSTDKDKPSIYTISYSSGDRQFQLQDGLITDYVLEPKKQATFYYSSQESNHIYFTMSMQKSSYLKDLQLTIKYCEPKNHIIDDSCWVDFKTDRPAVKEKTPHPTLMYLLPNKNHLALSLVYSGDHGQKVSLGINHQQIMILPFDVEFPFILHKNQSISFLVQLSNNGYIQIVTRKCDESNPTFSYTFDYDSFQKGQFTYESELGNNPKSRFMSKIKPGSLYMQMKTGQNQQSLVSILVKYSEKKSFSPQILPGNKGDIDYSIVDSSTASLTIKPPTCPDSTCPKLKYYLMSASAMRDLYTQLVCPSNFFTNVEFAQGAQVKLTEVTPKQNSDGTLTFTSPLLDQISYVGIKASNGKDKQVFYKPLQVATFWGQLSRTSHTHKLFIASIFLCGLIAIIICVRRNARRGYKPLSEDNQTGI